MQPRFQLRYPNGTAYNGVGLVDKRANAALLCAHLVDVAVLQQSGQVDAVKCETAVEIPVKLLDFFGQRGSRKIIDRRMLVRRFVASVQRAQQLFVGFQQFISARQTSGTDNAEVAENIGD